jgi:RNA polymerase sigma factor for flagellar operon FliA
MKTKTPHQRIEDCQGLVKSLAAKIHRQLPPHLSLDDLIGYGQLGLAEAARDFDASRGSQFSTFAYYRIRGAIYDGLSKMSWLKRSQYQRLKYEQLADDVLRLENEGGGSPGSESLEGDVEWLQKIGGAMAIVYLSTRSAGEDESDAMQIPDRSCATAPFAAIHHETCQKLRQLIDGLPADARSLLQTVYFEGEMLTEASRRLQISKAWASRLHARTLQQLARALRAAGFADSA